VMVYWVAKQKAEKVAMPMIQCQLLRVVLEESGL